MSALAIVLIVAGVLLVWAGWSNQSVITAVQKVVKP